MEWKGTEKMRGQRQENSENTRNMQPSDCRGFESTRSYQKNCVKGLHNAAFSEHRPCARVRDEASCHKSLLLCDKRGKFQGKMG